MFQVHTFSSRLSNADQADLGQKVDDEDDDDDDDDDDYKGNYAQ